MKIASCLIALSFILICNEAVNAESCEEYFKLRNLNYETDCDANGVNCGPNYLASFQGGPFEECRTVFIKSPSEQQINANQCGDRTYGVGTIIDKSNREWPGILLADEDKDQCERVTGDIYKEIKSVYRSYQFQDIKWTSLRQDVTRYRVFAPNF